MKKTFLTAILLSLTLFTFVSPQAKAETTEAINESSVNLYFFWGEECPHCAKEASFLDDLAEKYPELQINKYEVWESAENRQLMIEVGNKINANISGVPFTIVGEQYFIGWMDEKNTGAQIEEAVKCAIQNSCRDIGSEVINGNRETNETVKKATAIPETLTLPLIGEIRTKNLSLPVLTIIIGALDGFNPCAMWTLIFLISLLLGTKNRRRMWVLGIAFISTSAVVYFMFLSAWLNLLLFIGFILWVRVIIGLIALGGGGYYLKEYFFNPHAGCKVTGSEKRQRIFEKLRVLTHEKHFLLALGGIILLAGAVNLVELICSAGLPAVYTQILTLSDLQTWQYYGYLLLYIFVFMLDDLIVFFAAMITLRMTGLSDKYSNISHLVGGIIMVIIGILLLFKPEWLMFG